MAESTEFRCDYCNFVCCSGQSKLFFDHLVRIHSNEPNFKIFCNSCPRSFTKINSLQKHYYRQHKALTVEEDLNDGENENHFQEMFDEGEARSLMQRHAAKFLLCSKTRGMLTQSAVDLVKDSAKNLLTEYLDIVKKSLAEKINSNPGQELQFDQDVEKLFSAESVFDGVDSEYQQRSYFKRHFNLVVNYQPTKPEPAASFVSLLYIFLTDLQEPIEVEMGKQWRSDFRQGRKILKRVTVFGYQVPLLKTLEALLQNPDVLKEVENPHFSCDGVLRDVMDGDFFKSHPVFSLHSDALQLLGYYDDLEIANPLGSKAKIHKIGVFYFVLGNIRPMFRSSIRSIQLIAIAKTKDIKSFGIDNLLMPFIEDVNCLAKANGHCFTINGVARVFRGDLLLWTGDTLGSNYVSGFKEGVGGALRICRHCMGTRLETNNKFLSEDFSERDLDNHRQICACIEDEDNALNIREQLSTTYGVNRLSVLDKVQHFDVCICMPEDIMHILLEGLVPYETKLMLKYLIDESRCITLKELNRRMENFDYGYMNKKNKPTAITRETINGVTEAKLKQSASQMWCLFRFLPIMIGDKVDEQLENWHCLLKLWNIVQICTSPGITKADAAYLKVMINDHHKMFKNLYPNASIIPKMHYLIHIPDEIVRFGPPRNIWTMRFEAKHSFLKSSITKNFKNVPKSLAFSHQRNMCWNLLSSPKQPLTNYLYSGDVVGLGDHNVDLHSHPYFGMIAQAASVDQLAQPCKGSRHVRHVEIHGIIYKPGCALRLQEMDEIGERDYPVYGEVEEIVVWENRKFFVVRVLETSAFHRHFMCYQVHKTNERLVVVIQNLPLHGVLHIIKSNGKFYIVEKDSSNVEDFVINCE